MTPALYQIEDTLAQLVAMREEPELTDEERAAIDGQLEAWIGAEIKKVDGIRAYLRHAEMIVAAAREESDLQKARAQVWQNRIDRLKQVCKAAMEAFGVKRLEGKTGVLTVRGNGGMRALTITREDLIPSEYKYIVARIRGDRWPKVSVVVGAVSETRWEVDTGAVRKALEQKCANCEGTGIMCGIKEVVCAECNGTGGGTVPGARLEERGSHLEVK